MTFTQTTKPSAVLALAQYAYTRLEPSFARAKEVEPSIQFAIELNFADEDSVFYKGSHLHVLAHWARDGMFAQSTAMYSMEDVDRFAAKVADDAATLTMAVAA